MYFQQYLLVFIVCSSFFGAFLILVIPFYFQKILRIVTLWISIITFLVIMLIWILYDIQVCYFQFLFNFEWFFFFGVSYAVGLDSISLLFLLLTSFLIPICILTSWYSIQFYLKEYLICFLLLEGFLINIFLVLDIFLFYIFFETILLPIFIIIGVWGTRERKIYASYLFFLYTLVGSLFFLVAILLILFQIGSSNYQLLWYIHFSEKRQLILWIFFFLSFSIKIPMLPFHCWLLEAHCEAPTAGSVILAGVLLKLGGYAFLRFSILFFQEASIFFAPLIFTLSILAIIYASLMTLRQIDLKKIIAYSSIAHMGFVTLGIFSYNIYGLESALYLMISHGLISSGLFLLIGVLYDRFKTRVLKYFSGLTLSMPLFIIVFIFFSFSNIGFPGTSAFISEFLVFLSMAQLNFFIVLLISFSLFLSGCYTIWLINRLCFGVLKTFYLIKYQDISRREFFLFLPLVFFIIKLGIFPNSLNFVHLNVLVILDFCIVL
uniref:NADH dehydrogenase subunit 4 n=1 Tax=Erythrolobus coxiae TaxID=362235 RepID=UPI001FCD63DB|nr:NADH dehydrogenase subunit 4 [Erythrolobus coxiae]UNJ19017.1 NADH dehydrogenase subunit 4 [Erythrolobus coxiae]